MKEKDFFPTVPPDIQEKGTLHLNMDTVKSVRIQSQDGSTTHLRQNDEKIICSHKTKNTVKTISQRYNGNGNQLDIKSTCQYKTNNERNIIIRQLYKDGYKRQHIADMFDLSLSRVYQITAATT